MYRNWYCLKLFRVFCDRSTPSFLSHGVLLIILSSLSISPCTHMVHHQCAISRKVHYIIVLLHLTSYAPSSCLVPVLAPLKAVIGGWVLVDLLHNPRNIFRHVRIDTGQLRMGAHYTPGHDAADKPPVPVIRVTAEQWSTRVALQITQ